jgi:hypothetical protein
VHGLGNGFGNRSRFSRSSGHRRRRRLGLASFRNLARLVLASFSRRGLGGREPFLAFALFVLEGRGFGLEPRLLFFSRLALGFFLYTTLGFFLLALLRGNCGV